MSSPPSVRVGLSYWLHLCSCRTSLGTISWAQCLLSESDFFFLISPLFALSLSNCPSSTLTSFILVWFLTLSTYLSLSLLIKFPPALTLHHLFSPYSIFSQLLIFLLIFFLYYSPFKSAQLLWFRIDLNWFYCTVKTVSIVSTPKFHIQITEKNVMLHGMPVVCLCAFVYL